MKPIMLIMAGAVLAMGSVTNVFSAQANLNLAFSASGSTFQGGPTEGFDVSASTGGDIGVSFRARANSGTVFAHVNGILRAVYPAAVAPNGPAVVSLQFIGTPNGGSLRSDLGAGVNVDAHVRFSGCILPAPWPWSGCWQSVSVNETLSLLDKGFYLNPNKTFTPVLGSAGTGSDSDDAYGVGPSIDIEVGDLAANVSADVRQTIHLTPTALTGSLRCTNETTGATRQIPFSINPGQTVNVMATNLATGFWHFEILGLAIQNSFRNDVDLVLTPTIDYVIGDWSPGSVSFGLVDQTFALSFNTLQFPEAFVLEAQTPQAALINALDVGSLVGISSPTGIVDGLIVPSAWFSQSLTTHDGVDAAQSGPVGDARSSRMEATVTGPGVLTFWCRVSSETNRDFLFVSWDRGDAGIEWLHGGNAFEWQQRTIAIPNTLANEGTHKITWIYGKDATNSAGADAAWVDQVVFTPAPPNFERALDSVALTSITSPIMGNYSAAWFSQTNVTHDGVDAAQSGAIGDDKWSVLTAEIAGPGRLSFWWKISAGVNDRLYFALDGDTYVVPSLSGTSVWTEASLDIPAGNHPVGWLYDANYINTQPGGAGFVDEVVFTPYPFTYATANNRITITGYTGSGGAVSIPTTIAGLLVTSIGNNAFLNKTGVASVTLPNTLTNIGSSAFQGCTSLTNIVIPASVTTIATSAFRNCRNLAGFTVDALNPVFRSVDGVLFNKNLTLLILCPGGKTGTYTIPSSVTNIAGSAFYSCTKLTGMTIPNGVTSIGSSAFSGCTSLTNVTIGNNVTFMDIFAFQNCTSLTGVYFQGNTPSIDYSVFLGASNAIVYHGLETAGWNPQIQTSAPNFGVRTNRFGFSITGSSGLVVVVQACTNLANPTWLPVGTNTLESGPSYFSDAQWTNYPARFYRLSVATFGSRPIATWNPPPPYTYTTNNFAITITGYTGSGGAVSIPGTITGLPVTSIGSSAFINKVNLTSVSIPNGVTNIGDSAFRSCTSLTNVTIPNTVTTISASTFRACTNLASITIPASVTSIGDNAFANCTRLAGVTIPNGVTNIGLSAFQYCTSLTSITIPTSVTRFGSNAFFGCTSLISVTIGNSYIAYGAFGGCTNLTSVTIENSVTNIASIAFQNCTRLASITIPKSVTSIGEGAFFSCASLMGVYFQGSPPSLGLSVFLNATNTPASSATVFYLPGTTGWTPQIQSGGASFGVRTNRFGFNITGASNLVIVVEACTNLAGSNWVPVGTNDVASGSSYFSDPQWTHHPTRFYRLAGATFGGRPTVLWNPQVQTRGDDFGVRTNRFGFTITGHSNMVVVVEACTNLSNPNWSRVGTNTLTSGSSYFSDPQWANYPARFYRLRTP